MAGVCELVGTFCHLLLLCNSYDAPPKGWLPKGWKPSPDDVRSFRHCADSWSWVSGDCHFNRLTNPRHCAGESSELRGAPERCNENATVLSVSHHYFGVCSRWLHFDSGWGPNHDRDFQSATS